MSSLVRRVTGRLLWRGLTGMFLSSTLLFCQEIIPLTPGTTIERELKGGESNSFQVSLAAGHFLQIAVEQKGIDVEVILFGPDGKRISHMDSINGMWGPEPIVEIAEASGGTLVVGRSASGGGKVTVSLGSPAGPRETERRHRRNRLRLRA